MLFQSLSLHIIVLQMLSWRRNNWLFCRSPSIPVSALLSQSKTHFICPFLLSARMTGGRHIIKQPGGVPSHDSILHLLVRQFAIFSSVHWQLERWGGSQWWRRLTIIEWYRTAVTILVMYILGAGAWISLLQWFCLEILWCYRVTQKNWVLPNWAFADWISPL